MRTDNASKASNAVEKREQKITEAIKDAAKGCENYTGPDAARIEKARNARLVRGSLARIASL